MVRAVLFVAILMAWIYLVLQLLLIVSSGPAYNYSVSRIGYFIESNNTRQFA